MDKAAKRLAVIYVILLSLCAPLMAVHFELFTWFMGVVVKQPIATFDLSEIARGDLVYGKHRTWPEGKAGVVTSATEKELIVQYHPGIGNVTNHFRISIDEAVDGQWEIRYSHDMSEVKTYGIEEQDTEEGATE